MRGGRAMLLLLLATGAHLLGPTLAQRNDYSDLMPLGPFCATNPSRCCDGRKDDCSVPIYGTLCYCDDFCNRTRNEDCCPDFWYHCKGVAPPEAKVDLRCNFNGQWYQYGESTKINCNSCTCRKSVSQPNKSELDCEQLPCLVEPEVVSEVNGRNLGWRASNYSFFWGHTLDRGGELRLGTLNPARTVENMRPVRYKYDPRILPRQFDARSKWPRMISPVRDQGWCGSSWAMSTVQVASDRLALLSQGAMQVTLAAQQLLECNLRGQQGCRGGHLDPAWLFIRKRGLVEERCYPYVSSGTGKLDKCRVSKSVKTLVAAGCAPRQQLSPPRTSLYKTGPAYRIAGEQDIMYEIMESGPVQATMKVHRDFFLYRGGVYQPSRPNDRPVGYHSVRVLGWGEEMGPRGRPVKYWEVANTWGTLWGRDGYFRILRGENTSEIENYIIGVWPPAEEHGVSRNTFPPVTSGYGGSLFK